MDSNIQNKHSNIPKSEYLKTHYEFLVPNSLELVIHNQPMFSST
jgi:hypothetical protein